MKEALIEVMGGAVPYALLALVLYLLCRWDPFNWGPDGWDWYVRRRTPPEDL